MAPVIRPVVSVLVSAANPGESLHRTRRSLEAQTFPSVEVLLCEPGGFPSWSAALPQASGDFVCLLLAGDELAPTCLEKCLFQMAVNGEDAAVVREQPSGLTPHICVVRKEALTSADCALPRAGLVERLTARGLVVAMIPEVLAKPADAPAVSVPAAFPTRPSRPAGESLPGYADLIAGPPPSQPAILVAMPALTVGGSEATVSQLCRQLKSLGFRILLYTTVDPPRNQGDTTTWFEDAADGIYHLPRFLEIAHWPAFLAYLIQQHRVRVLWQIGSSFTYELLPRLRELFPHLAVVDLLFNTAGHAGNYLKHNFLIDRVVTEHRGLKDWLVARGEAEERISVIPNGVDVTALTPRPKTDWRTLQPRSPDDRRFVIAFFGRLSPEKAPDVFLAIAARLAGEPDLEFLLCGSGPLEASLRNEANSASLAGRVHFPGFVSTRDYLPCCDLVVVCSREDGRPNVLMESLSSGIPVVASRVGGIPEMLPPSEAGLLCDPANPEAFAAAILSLARDPLRYRQSARAAREFAESHLSVGDGGRAYALLFNDLQQKRRGLERPLSPQAVAARLRNEPIGPRSSPPYWTSALRNAVLLWRLRRAGRQAELRNRFDAAYYLRQFPPAKRWLLPPLFHYLFLGFRQGQNPSPDFDTRYYLLANPDVRRGGYNPLLHFLLWGQQEGRPATQWPAS